MRGLLNLQQKWKNQYGWDLEERLIQVLDYILLLYTICHRIWGHIIPNLQKKLEEDIDNLRDRYQNTAIVITGGLSGRIGTRQVYLSHLSDTTYKEDRNPKVIISLKVEQVG